MLSDLVLRNRWERWSRALVCALLAGLSGCAILPGAGMPFPDEVEDQTVAEETPVGPERRRGGARVPGPAAHGVSTQDLGAPAARLAAAGAAGRDAAR